MQTSVESLIPQRQHVRTSLLLLLSTALQLLVQSFGLLKAKTLH